MEKVSDYIANYLVEQGVDKVFGYIGGNNAHIFDSVDNHPNMELVNSIHEQGSGFAAEGYARVRNTLGVATATSGPGATNLITPLVSCFLDSIPVVFITGQVNTYEYKYDIPVRQIGFQETDIVSIVKPVTKYTVLIDNVENIRYELEKACFLAQYGRKGPVLVDIPINIQYQSFEPDKMLSFYESDEFKSLNANEKSIENKVVKPVVDLLNNAQKPLILVGGGVRLSNAKEELLSLLEKTEIPVISSLMGKDVVSQEYTYNLGFIGVYGVNQALTALEKCDFLLILGSRLDARQTTRDLEGFAANAKIVHVDIDQNELGLRKKADIEINDDIKKFLFQMNHENIKVNISEWHDTVLSYKKSLRSTTKFNLAEHVPSQILATLSKYLNESDVVCVDVGMHQMWSAQSLENKISQRVLYSGGLGAMGFALPVAIGATLGSGERAIVISGDGGFQMNLQELEVIKRRGLPIKVFIINNGVLGMVKQMQSEYLEHNYIGTQNDYSTPSFKKIAEAYGIRAHEISDIAMIENLIKKTLEDDRCEIIDFQLGEHK